MKTLKVNFPLFTALSFVFATLLGAGLMMAILGKGLDSSEAATWAGALATTAAVVAALWIAASQEAAKRTEALTVARISASGMLHRVEVVKVEMDVATQWFQNCQVGDANVGGFLAFLERLEKLPVWTQEELIRLAALPNNCAHNIAAALDRIPAVIALIRVGVAQSDFASDHGKRVFFASTICLKLAEANRYLGLAIREMKSQIHELTSSHD